MVSIEHARRGVAVAPAIRRVASMPSISGMRMSISTTSGLSPRDAVDRLRAVGALAHDLDVLLGVEDHAEAGADQRLVVDEQHADAHAGTSGRVGSRARAREAAVRSRARPEDAAVQRHALAHAERPWPPPAPSSAPAPAPAVVVDLDLDRVVGS